MPTDDERREVARRLRETGEELGGAALLWYHIAKALGVRAATDGKTACGMLADLIEPPHQCPYYDSLRHWCSVHDVPATDRDALLALADELDRQEDGSMYCAEYSDLHGVAAAIRRWCGEGR